MHAISALCRGVYRSGSNHMNKLYLKRVVCRYINPPELALRFAPVEAVRKCTGSRVRFPIVLN